MADFANDPGLWAAGGMGLGSRGCGVACLYAAEGQARGGEPVFHRA